MAVATRTRPFLKWVGGKTQLLDEIDRRLPGELKSGRMRRYVEPFIGGGAVFMHVAQHYPLREYVLFDVNRELVLAYQTIREAVGLLIERLGQLEQDYCALGTEEQRAFFYRVRREFNANQPQIDYEHFQLGWIERTAQIIFLNRTCYNGLFRTNARDQFNVPFGRYKNPGICNADNLRAVAELLQPASIRHGDFRDCAEFADPETFFYFDPPYRPLSPTARFTSYCSYSFDDAAQLRLADLFRALDGRGAKLMLSNSDPHNVDPEDDFFERAYAGFAIERVQAVRMVNCNAAKRGEITELLITNYEPAPRTNPVPDA